MAQQRRQQAARSRGWGARNAKKIHEAVRGGRVFGFGRKNKVRAVRGGKARKKRGVLTPEDCIKRADTRAVAVVAPEHTFADFGLDARLLAAVRDAGFSAPTPIQDRITEPILAGRDVIGLAQTGTGKTAAFLLPLMHRLLAGVLRRHVLVVVPTRELALQLAQEVARFSAHTALTHALVIGGASLTAQQRALAARPHIIIGTPGRLRDAQERGIWDPAYTRALVIDEVDRMVDMGFLGTLKHLIGAMRNREQTLVFSATLRKEHRATVRALLTNPVTVAVTPRPSALTVEQDVVWVRPDQDKVELLHDALIAPGVRKALVFVNTKADALALAAELADRGFAVAALQGDLSQGARKRITQQFRTGAHTVLVATDVAARGLDIPDVTHVINFDPPPTYDDYVHRIGRAGRGGRTGRALTFWSKG